MDEREAKRVSSDVSDEVWNFCVNYLTLMKEDAPQRQHSPRSVFNALHYFDTGRRSLAHVTQRSAALAGGHQQTQRWIKAGCLEARAYDLRAILLMALERKADPGAVILDSRIVQSPPGNWSPNRL